MIIHILTCSRTQLHSLNWLECVMTGFFWFPWNSDGSNCLLENSLGNLKTISYPRREKCPPCGSNCPLIVYLRLNCVYALPISHPGQILQSKLIIQLRWSVIIHNCMHACMHGIIQLQSQNDCSLTRMHD